MASKTAIISGGAQGIGRCLVRRFCELGCKVAVFDVQEEELKHTVETHLKKYFDSGHLKGYIVNLRDPKAIYEKVDEAAKDFLGSHIDVLINNGAIASPYWKDGKTMEDRNTLGEWQAYVETNLTGPFCVSQACIPYMKIEGRNKQAVDHDGASDAGPCILHIGSFRALQSDQNQEGYASTKAGQLGLMHSMAISLMDVGIRVNLIAPGRVKVEHESKAGDEKGMSWHEQNSDKDVDDHPVNRAGRGKDIADAAEYLVNAGFVTGQDITVDGGATKKK